MKKRIIAIAAVMVMILSMAVITGCGAEEEKPEVTVLAAASLTDALDENTKERIYEEFQDFRETLKISTILITHNYRESELFADKNVNLMEGKVI